MLSRFTSHLAISPESHAWLFLGAPREGAFFEVRRIVCDRLHLSLEAFAIHPDIHTVRAPEEKTATGRQRVISVEDIRDTLDRLALTALSGTKYLFLPDADLLSEAAQNALLKMIEDPVGILIAVFFTEDIVHIVAPLRSRLSLVALPVGASSAWQGAPEDAPDAFLAGDTVSRLQCIERLVKRSKTDVDAVLVWLVALQQCAGDAGNGKVFLAAVTAWEGIRAQGNVHAQLTGLVSS